MNWTLSQLKIFVHKRSILRKQKDNTENEIIANHIPDKGTVSIIYRELTTQQQKGKPSSFKMDKWLIIELTDISQKTIQIANKHMKGC